MSRHQPLYQSQPLQQWTDELAEAFPDLSRPQVRGLASWSFGMILARCCALTTVALFLAEYLGQHFDAARQRLREFYQGASAKKGPQRRDLEVSRCFAPLLRWVLRDWPERRLAVALDASSLGSLFVVLCVAVVYRGCAIPVAWAVLPAQAKGSWKRPWLKLLRRFHGALPGGWSVVALADRGLYARWLFMGIRRLGWHPLLRITGGTFRPKGWYRFLPMAGFVPCPGRRWHGRGTAFATPGARLRCTLLACWGEGHAEPWLLLTDLPPQGSDGAWYGRRGWVEQLFKDGKRGGWQWQHTRMADPRRAGRLWLAIAVATLRLVRVGTQDEGAGGGPLPQWKEEAEPERPRGRWRLVSVFARGWLVILVALLTNRGLPDGRLLPEPWPQWPEPWPQWPEGPGPTPDPPDRQPGDPNTYP